MASSRATTSAVSLDDWDSLAPLSDKAKASIALITEASSERPLPARLIKSAHTLQTNPSTRPGTPGLISSSTTNLLRRATSRADLANPHANGSNASSQPGTPRPRSPAKQQAAFLPSGGSGHHHAFAGGHSRTQSGASALGMQLYPNTMTTSSPVTYANGAVRQSARDPLELHAPIETPQQFLDWFSGVEASMERDQEEVYRRFEMEIDAYVASCDETLEMLEDSRGLIKEMEANYRFVEDNSKALQLACETMLEEQKHLMEVTDTINARLEYFKELENATRTLSQPGDKVVLEEDFLGMVQRLDVCLDFLKAKRNYRDAEVYLIRFQQCLTRSMTLIKMHFLQLLTSVAAEVSSKLSNASGGGSGSGAKGASGGGINLSDTALNALLYAKFNTLSQSTRPLLVELEKRALRNPDEYGSLLQECFGAWFGVRTQLLGPTIAEEVRRMDPQTSDLVKLARSGCAYLRNVCTNEWSLFRDMFAYTGQDEIYAYLETLCDYLYDSLRPRVLHEPKLEVLCELCSVLQALISLDGDAEDDDVGQGEEESEERQNNDNTITEASSFDITLPHSTSQQQLAITGQEEPRPSASRLRFSELLRTVLQDTQTRLVFRAQYVIEAEVLNYAPKLEDLDYPSILEKHAKAKLQAESADKGKGSEVQTLATWQRDHGGLSAMGIVEEDGVVEFKLPPEEIMETWYPTLRKTLWILSKLHSFVNHAIFEDFAGEAVSLCRQSLATAAERLSNQSGASKLDGQLFIIRHLLILKEMVRSLDLVSIERGVDFSSVTDALAALLRGTSMRSLASSLANPNALLSLAGRGIGGMMSITAGGPGAGIGNAARQRGGKDGQDARMRDAKRDLDASLKIICEDLMIQASLLVASSIRAFLTRCQAFLAQAEASTAQQTSAGTSGAAAASADLSVQEWATADEVLKLHDAFLAEGSDSPASLESGLREILNKLALFLDDDEKAIGVLVPPTLAEVLEHYTTFYTLIRQEYPFEVSSRIVPPPRVRERLKAIAGDKAAAGAWSTKARDG